MVRQAVAKNAIMIQNISLLSKALHHIWSSIHGHVALLAARLPDPSAEIALLLLHWERKLHTELVAMTICSMQLSSLLFIACLSPDGCLVRLVSQRPQKLWHRLYEVAPRRSDYALASAAAQINFDSKGTAKTIHVGVGSIDFLSDLMLITY